jgi:ATP-dependent Clp protease ATP-binding subunit ClpA
MTLSHRYYLEKAATLRKPTPREIDLAQRRNAEGLLGIPYFLIGQSLASHLLLRKLLSHILSPSKRPLVMVFAGPSGHGKTELARRLGHLLSLELEVVDCTAVSREIELFGPREPYSGAEKGSPLNNFLAKHSGQRCIVFLDEFEKTTTDIHKTLLLPFDNGLFHASVMST